MKSSYVMLFVIVFSSCEYRSTVINSASDIELAEKYCLEFNTLLYNARIKDLNEKYNMQGDTSGVVEISSGVSNLIGPYLRTQFDSIITDRTQDGKDNQLNCRIWQTNFHSKGICKETLFIIEKNSVQYLDSIFVSAGE